MTAPEPWAVGDTYPNAGTRSVTSAMLDADIGDLSTTKDVVQIVSVKVVFESVIDILTLVRDEMIDNDAFVGLTKSCVRACHVLKIATEERDVDSVSGSVKKAIESLKNIMFRIKSAIDDREREFDDMYCHPESTIPYPILQGKEIQKIIRALDSDLELDDALVYNKIERRVQRSTGANPSTSASSVTRKSGEHSPPLPAKPSLYPGERALQRLISGTAHQGERTTLIETICSSRRTTETVGLLPQSDAQTFIDAVDEALESPDLAARVRKKCLKSLYKACTSHALLPRSLQMHFDDNPTGVALYRGGFGDVWKREYRGQEVAVKVVRTYANSDLKKITRRFCKEFVTWKTLRHSNVLPLLGVVMSGTQFAMVSEWMPNGNIDQYVKAHWDANRFELLGDVAKGLIYMHGQGMVHGDLKGANILIDDIGHARLADFGLLAIISDATSRGSSSSILHGGTYRWMSPELFYPENFGLKDSRPTKYSDCYALGMVIYEVLSGQVPFPRHNTCAVVAKVSRGERPGRPRGAEIRWFTDGVWRILQHCWAPKRDHRPGIEEVLQCLEEASKSWTPLPPRKVADASTANSSLSTPSSSIPATEGSAEGSAVPSPSRVAMSDFASLLGEPTMLPIRGSAEYDAEEVAAEMRDGLVGGPLGRVDSSPHSSFSDRDGFIPEISVPPFEVDGTTNVDAGIFTSVPIPVFESAQEWSISPIRKEKLSPIFAKPPSSHKHATESPSRTNYRTAPSKPTSIPAPATSKQRGRKPRPRGREQLTSLRQSDPLLQSHSIKHLTISTVVEPPSSSHEYNTDSSSSTIGPVVSPKVTRIPASAISKQRGIRKLPHSSLPRDYIQPTFPRHFENDLSLQTAPGKSSTPFSTLVESSSSSYGYDTPLQTRHFESLALSSALAKPPSSPLEYDTDSSSLIHCLIAPSGSAYTQNHYPVVPPMPIDAPADRIMFRPKEGTKLSPPSERQKTSTASPYSPYPTPQAFSMDNMAEVFPYGDMRGLPTPWTRRGRFGDRTWKNWLRSSLGKLLGNSASPS